MTQRFQPDDLAAVIAEGSLVDLFTTLAGKQIVQPEPDIEDDKPLYHIPRKGAWPCGTAPTGPTPEPCDHRQEGTTREPHPKHP